MRKLKGSDEHLSVERAGSGQDALVSHKHASFPHKRSVVCLFKDRVNTPSLTVQRVAASPLHSTWKCCAAGAGAASNHCAQPWWEGQSEDERKLDKPGKLEKREDALAFSPPLLSHWVWKGGRKGVLFLLVDCGSLPPLPLPQQLLLLHLLMWSNPSLSCTVSLWDRYLSRAGDEAAGCGGSAASSIMDLFSTNASVGFYLLWRGKKGGGGQGLDRCVCLFNKRYTFHTRDVFQSWLSEPLNFTCICREVCVCAHALSGQQKLNDNFGMKWRVYHQCIEVVDRVKVLGQLWSLAASCYSDATVLSYFIGRQLMRLHFRFGDMQGPFEWKNPARISEKTVLS